ncbi:MAG: tetratricopeptide repeat protein [Armatimonadetes bacterium]|nr:tetratricopeptide repeat protein [Armatimonadota bacterium]
MTHGTASRYPGPRIAAALRSALAAALLLGWLAGCSTLEGLGGSANYTALREGVAKLKSGDQAAAMRILDGLLSKKGATAATYVAVAAACQEARRYDLSASYAERGLAETPAAGADLHGALYSLLGAARQQLGDYDRAIEAHQAAMHLTPEEPAALNNLAYAYADAPDGLERMRDAERLAREAIDQAVAKGKPSAEMAVYLDTLGWVQFKRGDIEHALVNLLAAADALPNEPDILFHLAQAYSTTGRLADARVMLERALRTEPKHARAARALSELLALTEPQGDEPRATMGRPSP